MGFETTDLSTWVDRELAGSRFPDARLGKRLRSLLHRLSASVGDPLPLACGDWASTKAAYRFLSNADVSEDKILAGHFAVTAERIRATEGPILVLQDTTEFVFKRARPEAIGSIGLASMARPNGPRSLHTVCGLLMHSSLAVTPEGLPLGLTAAKFWSRSKFKGTTALKRHINPTRVPIEAKESVRWLTNMSQSNALIGDPARCVHIGDRENDIYEFFCRAATEGTNFVVRTCVDRLAGDGFHTINAEMAEVGVAGVHRVRVPLGTGETDNATVEIRFKAIDVLPPIGKQKRYPSLRLTVIHARERAVPDGRPPVDWRLITNLAVETTADAVEKLDWYAMRWKIEVFHKILKSGCRAEDAKLRTADRLVNLIAIFCVVSWRIFWMTMMNRIAPEAPPTLVFTKEECTVLNEAVPRPLEKPSTPTLAKYSDSVARLGGYLARRHDPPPGNIVMWRGWRRLTDILIGYRLASALVGN
ncbi:IS4 family transposase [Lichenihabitans sp. Uapishka_5]|uniref:IS4 family transposase n=1 Tax=Lichenihabitans sp. Uapishka_5 TaxID=3037302 RepID=UPI0029E827C0|nr:IS4 family transposase [Lichenihabitans sp. Uapishka_5]MDX7954025.1 IS4 family transposase [Lichenihabitans sp. Uapishka_5]